MLKKIMRPVALLLVVSFCLLNFNVPNAQAKMVGTDAVIAGQQAADQRAQVADFMAREDVKQIMTQYGVDPVEAQLRVDSLSNEELANLAKSIDQLPAGGSAVGVIVGAALLVFIVLLITDLVGLTHVFPFV
jgi:uncharacterized iron-regulated membrane protein